MSKRGGGDSATLEEALVVQVITENGSRAIRTVRSNLSASVDVGDRAVTVAATGRLAPGETRTLEAAQILVRHLNDHGQAWGAPVVPNEDCDEDAVSIAPSGDRLRMTMTLADPETAQALGRGRSTEQEMTPAEGAERLWRALERKVCGDEIRPPMPRDQRGGLVMVLVAVELPIAADAVETFRADRGRDASALGFEAIWCVGPTIDLCFRLDTETIGLRLLRR